MKMPQTKLSKEQQEKTIKGVDPNQMDPNSVPNTLGKPGHTVKHLKTLLGA